MRALIDGDILVYKCGFAAQHKWYLIHLVGEEEYGAIEKVRYKKDALAWIEATGTPDKYSITSEVEVEPLANALHNIKTIVNTIMAATSAKTYSGFITGKGNYRESIAVTAKYKGNRDPLHKPVFYKEIQQYMVEICGFEVVDGMEADDAISMGQTEDTIICTIDKDLDQVPGWHYNLDNNNKYWVEENEADCNFLRQLITGDTVDNIVGLYGMGPAKAAQCIPYGTPYKEGICEVGRLYAVSLDNPEERLEENARLLWMSRKQSNDWRGYE